MALSDGLYIGLKFGIDKRMRIQRKMTMKRAILLNATSRYFTIIMNVFLGAVLARLVAPEDHGVMALITVFTTLFTTLSDLGLSAAIIQNKTLDRNDINSINSFSVYISLILSIAFFFFSNVFALFYGDPELVTLGRWLSISLFFNSANMVPNGILNRDKRFLDMAIRNISVCVLSAAITIIAAIYGAGIFALVIQAILTAFLNFVWSIVLTKQRFVIRFDISSVKKIASYSGYQYAFSVLNYFARNLDNLLAGKFIGAVELAFYSKAYNLMLYPVNNITGVISPVIHPIMSDYQDDKEYIYRQYIKLIKCLAIVSIFVETFCLFASADIIGLMYGENWTGAVKCFQILSVAIITQMITGTTGSIFQALGETRLLFRAGCINMAITILSTVAAIVTGKSIERLALFVALSYLMHFFVSFFIMMRFGFKRSFLRFLFELKKEGAIFIVLLLLGMVLPDLNYSSIVNLLIKFAYFGIAYIICLFITKEYRCLDILRRKKKD